jgi:hypothetical protein
MEFLPMFAALGATVKGLILLAIAALAWFSAAGTLAAEPKISFSRQIKPILAAKCFACHGPDEKERKAELRLDVRDEAVPAVIKPGDGEHSEVVVRMTTGDADMRMPPSDSKKPAVTADEAKLIRQWIDQGAEYDLWLDPKFRDRNKLLSMLRPFPADEMRVRPVSTFVNNARNEGEACVAPD